MQHNVPIPRLPERVTVVVRQIGRGGGSMVSSWAIQALQDRCDVTILSWFPVDVAIVNRDFGTSLDPTKLRFVRPPALLVRAVSRVRSQTSLFRHNALARMCRERRRRGADDVVVCFDNELDVGFPAIQYVHYPWAYSGASEEYLSTLSGRVRSALYRGVCHWLAPFSDEGIRQNLTLVNSEYVGGVTRERYGCETRTLPPPVPGDFPEIPWEEKHHAVVAAGRLTPIKNWETAVEVVEAVRRRGHDLELRFVGLRQDDAYERKLRELARTRPWFSLRVELTRAELTRAIAECRYGIHCMDGEHFGVVIGEMVRAGAVPFVHASGGQVEIVGHDPRLGYRTPGEAIEKLCAALESPPLLAELRAKLEPQRERYSAERFMADFREVVAGFTGCL